MSSPHFLFEYPLDLHYSQTRTAFNKEAVMFEYPLDLHYSQTWLIPELSVSSLNTLWIYTTLKPSETDYQEYLCLNTLWIYTTLKHVQAARVKSLV